VYRKFQVAYVKFWGQMARSTKNSVIALLSPALRAIVESAGFVPNELYRAEVLERLRGIYDAVSKHDAVRARTAMTDLEAEFMRRLSTGYPRQMERVVAWSDLDPDQP
jgi:DNA-binding FadR family transcriptional regulator